MQTLLIICPSLISLIILLSLWNYLNQTTTICPSATTSSHVKSASTPILADAVFGLPHTCPNSLRAGQLTFFRVCILQFSGRLLSGRCILHTHRAFVNLSHVVVLDCTGSRRGFGVNHGCRAKELGELVGVKSGTYQKSTFAKQFLQVRSCHDSGVDIFYFEFALGHGSLNNVHTLGIALLNRGQRQTFLEGTLVGLLEFETRILTRC